MGVEQGREEGETKGGDERNRIHPKREKEKGAGRGERERETSTFI